MKQFLFNHPLIIELLCIALVLLLFIGIKNLLAWKTGRNFIDFLIGDTGKLSIARLQAVMWAWVIIAFQVAALFTLALKGYSEYFRLEFSEGILWLLGLSLANYVAVKGITLNHIRQDPTLYKSKTWELSDLVTSDNGLDFSKFQMLAWTIIALGVYIGACTIFISKLATASNAKEIGGLFAPTGIINYIPDIDESFLVLMGLSQGVYVGKKLVPAFKINSYKADQTKLVDQLKTEVQSKKEQLLKLQTKAKTTPWTEEEKKLEQILIREIKDLENRVKDLEIDLTKLIQSDQIINT